MHVALVVLRRAGIGWYMLILPGIVTCTGAGVGIWPCVEKFGVNLTLQAPTYSS